MEKETIPETQIEVQNLDQEVEKSFIEYALSVLLHRAIPNIRDGLKPVQRRIIYSMYEQKLDYNKGFKTSSKTVGDVGGKYHPHSEDAVYGAIVKLTQPFSIKMPLIKGQGNFGSRDGDEPASRRYTQIKLAAQANHLIEFLDTEGVTPEIPNYDLSLLEPEYFITFFPFLLVNGANNIAVGLSTMIPPHNRNEVLDLLIYKLKYPQENIINLVGTVFKGPDFPNNGKIIIEEEKLKKIYEIGNGTIVERAPYIIEKNSILFTDHPNMTVRGKIISQISEQARDKFQQITKIIDESDREDSKIRILVQKNTSEEECERIIKVLYKFTDLRKDHYINLTYVHNNKPVIGNLSSIIDSFIEVSYENLANVYEKKIQIITKRILILEANLILRAEGKQILEEIKEINSTEELKEYFKIKYQFNAEQQQYAVSFPLSRFIKRETKKVQEEKNNLFREKENLTFALSTPEQKKFELIKIFTNLKTKEQRLTLLETGNSSLAIGEADIFKDEQVLLILQNKGQSIKKIALNEIKTQQRGGQGFDVTFKKEDDINFIIQASNREHVFAISNKNRRFILKIFEISLKSPRQAAQSLNLFVPLMPNERIIKLISKEEYDLRTHRVIISENGKGLILLKTFFARIKGKKTKKIALFDEDVQNVIFFNRLTEKTLILRTENTLIRRALSTLPFRKSVSTGVQLLTGHVIGSAVLKDEKQKLIVASENGYRKIIKAESIREVKGFRKGIKAQAKNNKTAGVYPVISENFIVATKKGKLISFTLKDFEVSKSIASVGLKIVELNVENNKDNNVRCIINIKE
jgi:DNA gyrase subunit A